MPSPWTARTGGREAPVSDSVMQDRRECYATRATVGLDRHHVFKASRRKASEEMGLWVWLLHDVHMAMHDHRPPWEALEEALKAAAQRAWEESGGTRAEWMRRIGANYLGGDAE